MSRLPFPWFPQRSYIWIIRLLCVTAHLRSCFSSKKGSYVYKIDVALVQIFVHCSSYCILFCVQSAARCHSGRAVKHTNALFEPAPEIPSCGNSARCAEMTARQKGNEMRGIGERPSALRSRRTTTAVVSDWPRFVTLAAAEARKGCVCAPGQVAATCHSSLFLVQAQRSFLLLSCRCACFCRADTTRIENTLHAAGSSLARCFCKMYVCIHRLVVSRINIEHGIFQYQSDLQSFSVTWTVSHYFSTLAQERN